MDATNHIFSRARSWRIKKNEEEQDQVLQRTASVNAKHRNNSTFSAFKDKLSSVSSSIVASVTPSSPNSDQCNTPKDIITQMFQQNVWQFKKFNSRPDGHDSLTDNEQTTGDFISRIADKLGISPTEHSSFDNSSGLGESSSPHWLKVPHCSSASSSAHSSFRSAIHSDRGTKFSWDYVSDNNGSHYEDEAFEDATHENEENDPCARKYIKMPVTMISSVEEEPLSGCLLITPNTLMFSPCTPKPDNPNDEDVFVVEYSLSQIHIISLYSSSTPCEFGDVNNQQEIKCDDNVMEEDPCRVVVTGDNDKEVKTTSVRFLYMVASRPFTTSNNEYWFELSVPDTVSDSLCAFLLQSMKWSKKGTVFVHDDTNSEIAEHLIPERRLLWQLRNDSNNEVNVADADLENLPLPNLSDESLLLSEEKIRHLMLHLPPEAEGHDWRLAFSTSRDGCSLKTLYRLSQSVNSPCFLIMDDDKHQVFGALLSDRIKMSSSFYGRGDTYLFRWRPQFQKFRWSGENRFFIKGNPETLMIGCSDGQVALWLDDQLHHGRTQACSTFNNPPLLLNGEEDFLVNNLEVWAFD